jgi:hypothetical protein
VLSYTSPQVASEWYKSCLRFRTVRTHSSRHLPIMVPTERGPCFIEFDVVLPTEPLQRQTMVCNCSFAGGRHPYVVGREKLRIGKFSLNINPLESGLLFWYRLENDVVLVGEHLLESF